jgi:hypothetical protein
MAEEAIWLKTIREIAEPRIDVLFKTRRAQALNAISELQQVIDREHDEVSEALSEASNLIASLHFEP